MIEDKFEGQSVINLPLPILAAVLAGVAGVLSLRVAFGNRAANLFIFAFFCTCGISAFLVGLRFGYKLEVVRTLQPVFPLLAGPTLYLGFRALTLPPDRFRISVALHLGLALAVILVTRRVVANRDLVDLAIALSYLCYGGALLALWIKGVDYFSHARIGIAQRSRRWALWGALLLFAFSAGDTAIAISFAREQASQAVALIAVGSLVLITIMLAAIAMMARRTPDQAHTSATGEADGELLVLEAKARKLLSTTNLFLETDLSIDRLARRLHVPTRNLSAAINATQGINVSQYVNGFRVEHAAQLLRETDQSAVKIAEASGFLTRSNFYREFQRIKGVSPAAFRKGA